MSEGRTWINPKYTILEIDAAELNRFPKGTEVIQVEGAELSQIPVYKPLQLTDEMKEKLSKKIHEVFYSDPVYIESDGTTSEGNNTAELIQSWYENRRD